MKPESCSLGFQVADYIETMFRHGPGDVQGEPLHLDDDFYAATVRAYQLNPESGRRMVRRYVLSRPKGRAKSEWAGTLVCAELLGPVRFDHWAKKGESSWWGYEYETGEPVGAPVTYPFIRCLATEEGQAGNTYDNVQLMLQDAYDDGRIDGVDVGLTRVFLKAGGEIRPSTASDAAKDGGKESFAVYDETHLYVLPALRRMHDTVRRNLRKRQKAQPWSLETTTMYEQGAESIAETTHRALVAGELPADVVFDHHQGPDPQTFKWDDDAALLSALGEAYGEAAEWMDLPGIVAEIRDPETDPADAVRYFLNRASASARDLIPIREWDQLADPNMVLEAGDAIALGFDGSDSDDSCALVAVRGSDGLTVPLGLWERPSGATDWRVDRDDVHATIRAVMDTYTVVRLYADMRYWETDVQSWENEYGTPTRTVMKIPQSTPRLYAAANGFVTLIRAALAESTESAGIVHDGDPDLRRHILNTRRVPVGGRGSARDGWWKPGKKAPSRKIDLASAAMFGHVARGDALADGEFHLEVDVQAFLV